MKTIITILFGIVFYSCILSGEEIPMNKNHVSVVYSLLGIKIMEKFQHAIVADYEIGDKNLYGLSGNPNGKRIKFFMNLEKNQAEELRRLCLDPQNLLHELRMIRRDDKRNMNQGVEYTDGFGYIRVYFTQDAEFCKFFSSSGDESPILKCSEKLRVYAKMILDSRDATKMHDAAPAQKQHD